MPDAFSRYLQNQGTFTPEELNLIESLGKARTVKKKQLILRAGEVCHYHTFICKGCMKLYRINDAGEEHIIKFAVEDWWVSDRESLLTGAPAESYIMALEDTEVLQWTNYQFERLYNEVPEFDALFKRLVSNALNAS